MPLTSLKPYPIIVYSVANYTVVTLEIVQSGTVVPLLKKLGTSDYWEETFCKIYGQFGINFNTIFCRLYSYQSLALYYPINLAATQLRHVLVCQGFALYFVGDCFFVISAFSMPFKCRCSEIAGPLGHGILYVVLYQVLWNIFPPCS